MDSELVNDCDIIARKAYRLSLVVTAIIVLVFIAFAVDAYLIGTDPVRSYRHTLSGQIVLAVKIVITFALCLVTLFRLGGYLTYGRFIDTMAKKKPETIFMILKRHRDSVAADQAARRHRGVEAAKATRAALDERVKTALEQ